MRFYNDKLVLYRKQSHLSAIKITELMGICRATYWKWEKGKSVPNKKQIRSLAKILEVSVSDISDLEIPSESNIAMNIDFSSNVESWLSFMNMEENKNIKSVITNALKGTIKLNDKLHEAGVIIKALLSGIDSIFYVKDSDLKYITANEAFLKNVSLKSTYKVYGKTDEDFFSKREAKENYLKDEKVLLTKEALVEEEFIPGTRNRKWGIITRTPVLDINNNISGVITNIVDITERKKAENSNELLRNCIMGMTDGVVIYDQIKNKNIYMNESISKILDCPLDVLYQTGRKYWLNHSLSPEDRKIAEERIKTKKWPKVREQQIRCSDNSVKWIEIRNSVLNFSDGKEYVISIISDITKEKKNKESLHMLEVAMENIDEGVWVAGFSDSDMKTIKFKYLNKAVEKILGTNKEDMLINHEKWAENPELWADISDEEKKNINKTRYSGIWPRYYNYKAVRKSDNKEIWVSEKLYKHKNMTFGTIKDKTDFERLDEYRDLLFSFMDMQDFTPFWLVEQQPIYRFLYANRSFEELVKHKKEDFYNKPDMWKNCIYPPDLDKVVSREFKENESFVLEYRMQQPDGTIIPVIERTMKIVKFGKEVIGGTIIIK